MSNEYLFRFKLSESPLCHNCNTIENYYHLFYDCYISRLFWSKFSKFCVDIEITVKNVEINYEEIVIGRQGGNECKHIAFYNILINLGTHTIFKEKRKLHFKDIFDEFIEELKWRSKIQKYVFWRKCETKMTEPKY